MSELEALIKKELLRYYEDWFYYAVLYGEDRANEIMEGRQETEVQCVFVGKTPEGAEIKLYIKEQMAFVPSLRHVKRVEPSAPEFHLTRPDGQTWALSPGSEVTITEEFNRTFYVEITSPEWSGTAKGYSPRGVL